MLDHFGLYDGAKAVRNAIEITTGNGMHTRDVGGTPSPQQVTAAIIDSLVR